MKTKSLVKYFLLSSLLVTPMALSSCNNTDETLNYENVENYVLKDGVTYSGQFYEGKINGKGKISYANRDTLEGEFIDGTLKSDSEATYIFYEKDETFNGFGSLDSDYNFSMIEGKLELDNNRFYEGKFKNNLYDDEEAIFDFGANTYYKGPFKDGSNVGLVGTIYYPSHKMEGAGIWYFKGKMASLGKFEANQLGEGFIKFGDWSTYEGQIYYDGSNWLRKGEGVQDFSKCGFNASTVGGPSNLYLDKYVGEFDYEISEWIYGNGIMYYSDDELNPAGYTKGFYTALKRIKEPTKELELLPEYQDTKEYAYDPENLKRDQIAQKWVGKKPDIVFCGDSYMEMWQNSYGIASWENDTKDLNAINTGIGGTIAAEWEFLSDKLIYDFNPNKVVIHLGFNDTHFGIEKEDVINSLEKIIDKLTQQNSNIKIYLLGVEPSPAFATYFEKETALNEEIEALCGRNNNLTFIDTPSLFIENGETISNLKDYFNYDMVHLNKKGYELWWNKIKSII